MTTVSSQPWPASPGGAGSFVFGDVNSKRSIDPTQTLTLRRALHSALSMRLRQLKSSLRKAVIEQDVLGLGQNLAAHGLHSYPARLSSFEMLVTTFTARALEGDWLAAKLARAWVQGRAMACREIGRDVYSPLPEDVLTAARIELSSIETALNVQASRAASGAIKSNLSPSRAWQNVAAAFDNAVTNRAVVFATTQVVATHLHAKVAAYRQADISHVGVVAERKPLGTPSQRRGAHHDGAPLSDAKPKKQKIDPKWEALRSGASGDEDNELVGVRTAGDDDVCYICQDIADDAPYTLDEILDLLPAHPNDRCTVYPWYNKKFAHDEMQSALGFSIPYGGVNKKRKRKVVKIAHPSDDMDSYIIDVAEQVVVPKWIVNGVDPIIDRDHDVRWMSELSADGEVFYIDRSLPYQIENNGKQLDPVRPLLKHEGAEFAEMLIMLSNFRSTYGREPDSEDRKHIYLHSHYHSGNPAERSWIDSNGFDWETWEAWCRGELSRLEHEPVHYPPPNPDVKPLPHDRRNLETEAMDAFNPDEPRNEKGEWSAGGGSGDKSGKGGSVVSTRHAIMDFIHGPGNGVIHSVATKLSENKLELLSSAIVFSLYHLVGLDFPVEVESLIHDQVINFSNNADVSIAEARDYMHKAVDKLIELRKHKDTADAVDEISAALLRLRVILEKDSLFKDSSTIRRSAVGVLFVTPDNFALFMKRQGSDHANEWSIPAGHIEDGEDPSDAASREAVEETCRPVTGLTEKDKIDQRMIDGFEFHTYMVRTDKFNPIINNEHSAFVWAPLGNPPAPLYPGLGAVLREIAIE